MATAYTELEAVNEILNYLDELRISSLTDVEDNSAADTALQVLRTTTLDVQLEGPPECVEKDYSIALDGSGYVNVPSTALTADMTNFNYSAVVRDDKLYDLDNHTFDWSDVFGSNDAKVDVIWNRGFNNLERPTQRYILMQAAQRVHVMLQGDASTYRLIEHELTKAKTRYRQYVHENRDATIMNSAQAKARMSRFRVLRGSTYGWR